MPRLQKYKIIFLIQSFMDIKEYSKLLKAKRKEMDDLMRRRMPVIAGRMAKDHFQDNFRQEGFVNGGLHPWPKAKRLSSGRTDAAGNYGTLLSGRNHLFSSVKYVPADYRVRVADELVYAPVHNWGGEVNPTVTPQMRRFAWAKYYQASGKAKKAATGKRKGKKSRIKDASAHAIGASADEVSYRVTSGTALRDFFGVLT